MSQQLFHCDNIYSTIYQPGSKRVTQSVPRHAYDSRFLAREFESCFQINKRLAGFGIVENKFIPFAERPILQNLSRIRVDRNSAKLLRFGCKNIQSVFLQVHVLPAKRKDFSNSHPRIQSKTNQILKVRGCVLE